MRKPLAIILSMLLLAMLAAPAAATPDFSLKVNDQVYDGVFSVIDGTTMVPLDWAGSIIGAQTAAENGQIKIVKDQAVMTLALNSKEASFNQRQETMLQAPAMENDVYTVPLRYVLESFGTQVTWDPATYEIIVKPQTAADQIFIDISAAMIKSNSYKMKADTTMQMDMKMGEETQQMSMSGIVNASMSQEPLLMVMDTVMNIDSLTGIEEEIPADLPKSQAVLNEDGYFLTMPGYEGWIKLDMEGFDFNTIMEQYGSQDPIQSIMQMKESGALITEKDDLVIGGKTYGVVHVVMGQEAFAKYFNDVLGQSGLLNLGISEEDSAEVEAVLKDLFTTLKADMTCDIIYDKETLLPSNMTMDNVMSMTMNLPADETTGTPAQTMEMKIMQKADYELYDYGIAFPVPIIDEYKTMDEWMAEQMATLPVAEEVEEIAETEAVEE